MQDPHPLHRSSFMFTIFLFINLSSSKAFSTCWAEFLGVVLDGSENWANGFFVDSVDVLLSLPFDGYEVAFK